MIKCRILLMLCLSVFLISPASANIMVDNGKLAYTVKPGETISGEVTVYNTASDEAVTLKVYWEDFEYVEPYHGEKKFHPAGTLADSCRDWVVFSPSELTLAPLSNQKVNFTLKVPEGVLGGYYGVLFFESRAETDARIGLSLATRLGALFFLETEDTVRSAELNDVHLTDHEFEGTLKNAGNAVLSTEGVYYTMDSDGLVVDRGKLPMLYLPPGKSTPVAWPVPEELQAGDYTLILTFDLGGETSLVKEIDFQKTNDGKLDLLEIRN